MKISSTFMFFICMFSLTHLEGLDSSSEEPSTPEMIYQREFWNAEDPSLSLSSTQPTQINEHNTDNIQTESNLQAVEELPLTSPDQEPKLNHELTNNNTTEPKFNKIEIDDVQFFDINEDSIVSTKINITDKELQEEFLNCFLEEENRRWPILAQKKYIPNDYWVELCKALCDKEYDPAISMHCTHNAMIARDSSKTIIHIPHPINVFMKVDLLKCGCRLYIKSTQKYLPSDPFFISACTENTFFTLKKHTSLFVVGLYTNVSIIKKSNPILIIKN